HADHASATQFAEKGTEGRCRGGVAHASFHACVDRPSGLVVMAASEYPVGTMSPRTGDPYRDESTPASCIVTIRGKACPGGCLCKASPRQTHPYRWRSLLGWWRHYRVLILHDQPSRAALDQDERAYVLFIHVPYAVRAGERAHATGHGRHRRILVRKAHVQLFDVVRHAAQK